MRNDRAIDTAPLAAYQGVPGAFGETAIHRVWEGRARPFPMPTFLEAVVALRDGTANWAVIPLWNSISGPVAEARQALEASRGWAERVREIDVPVSLCLAAREDSTMADIRFVGSHPAALAQCRRMFGELPHLVPCDAFNTAGAVRDLACYEAFERYADPSQAAPWYATLPLESPSQLAAIASERAAELYGLEILRRNVHDDPENRTRFVVLRAKT